MAALMIFRRCNSLNSGILSRVCNLCSWAPATGTEENESNQATVANNMGTSSAKCWNCFHLYPTFSPGEAHSGGFEIELVDPDAWRVSSGLTQAWRGTDRTLATQSCLTEAVDEPVNYSPSVEDEPDLDEIEDLRIRGNLFYKLDRDSKEFEEYNFSFRRNKSSKNKVDAKESKRKESSKVKEKPKEKKKMEILIHHNLASGGEKLIKVVNTEEMNGSCIGKKIRTPTFNQLTGPYHEPFCLDIFISKSSVRACIVHRVTSKVVSVAHSISKDMKFDLASTKNSTACAAIGEILAQRALADDIHDVVYTPRKGEKLEGKLQIVLQSIINNGISVKVKMKQKRAGKVGLPSMHSW